MGTLRSVTTDMSETSANSEADVLLTVQEVAQLLPPSPPGRHPKTVQRMCRSGKLCARKVGRQWFITGLSLRQYILGQASI